MMHKAFQATTSPQQNRLSVLLAWALLCALLPLSSISLHAEEPKADTRVQLPNMPLKFILLEYEKLSGTKVITDPSSAAATLSIETSGLMTKNNAAAFIEKSLLHNGFALVPAGEGLAKLVSYSAGGQPRSEGVPVISHPSELPEGDAVVSFIMPLQNISPEEAARTFTQVAPSHPYGTITPLGNAQAIIITENTSVIRSLLDLKEHIDVPPSQTTQRSFVLERATATKVAEALTSLLGLEDAAAPSSAPQVGGGLQTPQNVPGVPQQQGVDRSTGAQAYALVHGGGGVNANAAKPKIHAVDRTNSILVIARPVDMAYIESLIDHLDSASLVPGLMRRELAYIPALEFLSVAQNAILRGAEGGGQTSRDSRGLEGSRDALSGGGSSFPSNSQFGGGGGMGGQIPSIGEPKEQGVAQSIVVGKTLIVADPTRNEIFASGPPEHMRILNELLDFMDKRPRQVFLNMVIGQFNIGDNLEAGIDVLGALDDFSVKGRNGYGAGAFRSTPDRAFPDPASLTSIESLAGLGSGMSLYGHIGRGLTAAVTALESTNRFKLLSRPSIYAMNNEKAFISTGQKIAVPTSTLSSIDPTANSALNQSVTSNIGFEEVQLRIEVIPLINSDDEVTLQISQVNDDIVGSTEISGNRIPTIGTEALSTTVIVPNGRTVMLGGLVTEDTEDSVSGLPLFVRVPFLKHLFGKTNHDVTRQELVILIQPHILDELDSPGFLKEVPLGRSDAAREAEEFLGDRPVRARAPGPIHSPPYKYPKARPANHLEGR